MLESCLKQFKLVMCSSVLMVTVATAGQPDIDCQCRDPQGNRRDLGTVECVNITGTQYLVRCEMSTNTPYWKRIKDDAGCPLALAV